MRNKFSPVYKTKKCADLTIEDFVNFSHLFSANYGRWSGKDNPVKKGKRIKLPVAYYERLSHMDDMFVSYCEDDGLLLGSCFFLKKTLANKQVCVWITQLVVDNSYRKRGIATRLLQSAWGFSDYHAWGLATANTVTIKTLESVTWRKVEPTVISDNIDAIRNLCESLPYKTSDMNVKDGVSIINTDFFIDREKHDIDKVFIDKLGELPDGYEWLAFTFQTQEMSFDQKRLNELLDFSSEQLNDAYSRMDMESHPWAKGTSAEIDTIEKLLNLKSGCNILDIGCGQGRHSLELARRGYNVYGIDSSDEHIHRANAKKGDLLNVNFKVWDARKRLTGKSYDNIICLYDVIGSFRTLEENKAIVRNLSAKLHKGGRAVISVMNMEHIRLRATNRGDVQYNPRLLLSLKASNTMQSSGDMFNPEYQLLDEKAHLVYHKEQFEQDGLLSAEYVVADYRFTQKELTALLEQHGLKVLESRFVRAGRFDEPLSEDDDKAKEILFVVEKD